jgi:hypothetical protein
MDKLRYVFRRPVFPIICKIGEELVSGNTIQQFERRLKGLHFAAEENFPLIDATGEGWVLVPKFRAISPLTLDKRWSKNRVVEMFNASANAQRAGLRYPYRSLSSRRMEVVVHDVADLLNHAQKIAPKQPVAKPAAVD